jgi:hypothetical protein
MRCDHCPLATDLACPGEGARRLCDLIDPAHPAYQPGYITTIRGHASNREKWPVKSGQEDPEADRPSPAESMALVRAMHACIYRATHPPCGCSGGRCGLRNGCIVSHRECFECLRRFDAVFTDH